MLQITRVQPHGNEVPSSRPPLERPGVMRWDENWYHKDLDYCLSLYIILSSWLLRASGGPFLYKKKEDLKSTDFRLAKYLSLERQRFVTFEKEENFLIPDVRLLKLTSSRKMSFFMQNVIIIFRLFLLYVHLFLTQPLNSAHWGALWNKQIWKKMGGIQVSFRFLMVSGKTLRIGTHGWWW